MAFVQLKFGLCQRKWTKPNWVASKRRCMAVASSCLKIKCATFFYDIFIKLWTNSYKPHSNTNTHARNTFCKLSSRSSVLPLLSAEWCVDKLSIGFNGRILCETIADIILYRRKITHSPVGFVAVFLCVCHHLFMYASRYFCNFASGGKTWQNAIYHLFWCTTIIATDTATKSFPFYHASFSIQNKWCKTTHVLLHIHTCMLVWEKKKAHCLSRLEKYTRMTHMAYYGQSCNLTTMMLPPSPTPTQATEYRLSVCERV